MHVALTSNFSPWSSYSGGGQRSTHALATALVALGHEVTVIFTKAPGERVQPGSVAYDLRWATFVGLKSRRDAPLRPLNAGPVAKAVLAAHRQRPIDVIHSQGEEGALMPALASRLGCPFVITPRFPWYPEALQGAPWRKAWLWLAHTKYPLLGAAARRAAKVCPTSGAAAERVIRAYDLDPDKVEVVPNGVNPQCFDYRWRAPVDPQAPVVFFGRLHEDKGVDTLLRAMAHIDRPVQIIGRGDDQPALEALARDLGMAHRVRFSGWAQGDALLRALAGAAVVALPSRHESFGNAMAEAMAVGAPLVTTDAGSIPEVVGDAALTVPPDDAERLGGALRQILSAPDHGAALGAAGRARIEAKFQWSAVAQRFAEIYAGVR